MLPSDPRLDADVLQDLDRLDAALRDDTDADPDTALLVADVRATRPVLDATARARLDDRARAAKAAAGESGRRSGRRALLPAGRGWRAGIALAAVVAVAVPVAGVVVVERSEQTEMLSMSLGDDDGSGPAKRSVPESARGGAPSTESADATSSSSSGSSGARGSAAPAPAPPAAAVPSSSATGAPRRVVRDVRQTLRVAPGAVAQAAARVSVVVEDAGGYLATSSVRERGVRAGGTFDVVVPSARLNATVAALGRIGRPVRLERSATDVTDQATSLQDRLDDLRADRSALRLTLARTVDADRRAARRRELRLLSSRVARLTAQRDDLRTQTANSRIALRLTTSSGSGAVTTPADDDGGSWGLSDAWRDAGRVLEVVAGALLVGGVVAVPLALLAALGVALRRRAARRRRDRTIDAT